MMPKRREQPTRDQATTTFTQILGNLLDASPGAIATALVDTEGETVDYAGSLEAFDIKITAAHLQIELRHAAEGLRGALGKVHEMIIRGRQRSYAVTEVLEGYILIVVLGKCSGFGLSPRAVAQARFDLMMEAGFEPPEGGERWVHVRVEAAAHDHYRPRRVQLPDGWCVTQVMGAVVGLADGERGYRVRTENGTELTLVRERMGRWYADMQFH